MNTYYTKEEQERIIALYKTGLNTVQVAKLVGRSQTGVERFLKKIGIYKKYCRKVLTEHEKEIIDLYLRGYSTTKIARMYNVTDNTIARVLRDNNVTIRSSGNSIGKEDYFNIIDNECRAYFLGLIIADGCILDSNKNKQRALDLTLRNSDIYLLQKFLDEVGSQNRIIRERNRTTSHIRISSDRLCDDLAKYGVVPRKTFKTYLPIIADDLMSHLIRGFFDGNGCIYRYEGKNKVVFYGTNRICNDIQDHLTNKLDINRTKIFDKATVSMYSIGRQEDIKKFYHYIYDNASIFMIRKKEKFIF